LNPRWRIAVDDAILLWYDNWQVTT